MIRIKFTLFIFFCHTVAFSQFAPPVGKPGTTAMHKDSNAFVSWATSCNVTRGYQDISNPSAGYANVGDSSFALGIAGSNGVVSLGDGGNAVLKFPSPVTNGPGWDFAVFENSFSDNYLELAFVEVSSDGINFFRFPATSNTQDTLQIGGFDTLDARKINNLAGKYRALHGTPFDLQELSATAGLNVDSIVAIKIIDVVGSIQNQYASYDQYGKKINDPWKTPFPSSGFDLDALGIIHQMTNGVKNIEGVAMQLNVFPNPANNQSTIQYYLNTGSEVELALVDISGKEIQSMHLGNQEPGWKTIPASNFIAGNGLYYIKLKTEKSIVIKKVIIINE